MDEVVVVVECPCNFSDNDFLKAKTEAEAAFPKPKYRVIAIRNNVRIRIVK